MDNKFQNNEINFEFDKFNQFTIEDFQDLKINNVDNLIFEDAFLYEKDDFEECDRITKKIIDKSEKSASRSIITGDSIKELYDKVEKTINKKIYPINDYYGEIVKYSKNDFVKMHKEQNTTFSTGCVTRTLIYFIKVENNGKLNCVEINFGSRIEEQYEMNFSSGDFLIFNKELKYEIPKICDGELIMFVSDIFIESKSYDNAVSEGIINKMDNLTLISGVMFKFEGYKYGYNCKEEDENCNKPEILDKDDKNYVEIAYIPYILLNNKYIIRSTTPIIDEFDTNLWFFKKYIIDYEKSIPYKEPETEDDYDDDYIESEAELYNKNKHITHLMRYFNIFFKDNQITCDINTFYTTNYFTTEISNEQDNVKLIVDTLKNPLILDEKRVNININHSFIDKIKKRIIDSQINRKKTILNKTILIYWDSDYYIQADCTIYKFYYIVDKEDLLDSEIEFKNQIEI